MLSSACKTAHNTTRRAKPWLHQAAFASVTPCASISWFHPDIPMSSYCFCLYQVLALTFSLAPALNSWHLLPWQLVTNYSSSARLALASQSNASLYLRTLENYTWLPPRTESMPSRWIWPSSAASAELASGMPWIWFHYVLATGWNGTYLLSSIYDVPPLGVAYSCFLVTLGASGGGGISKWKYFYYEISVFSMPSLRQLISSS